MTIAHSARQLFLLVVLLATLGCTSHAQSRQVTTAINTATSEASLDQMLAPIALYPDSVLTHVLIASTYPLEIVQAARWLEQNPGLSGDAAVTAASKQDWDPSVIALVAFPQLLKQLNDDLIWTQQLGEAFLDSEAAVMASVQRLRQHAYAQGSLNKMEHLVVEREREVIIIEPARREVVYVPYYDTRQVYGNWWWPTHPPVYWHQPRGYQSGITFYWGSGFNLRPSFYFSIFDWHRHHVVVHHHYHKTPPRHYPKRQQFKHAPRWQHDHYHRRGVNYQHSQLRHNNDRSQQREYRQQYQREQHAKQRAAHQQQREQHAEQRAQYQRQRDQRSELQAQQRQRDQRNEQQAQQRQRDQRNEQQAQQRQRDQRNEQQAQQRQREQRNEQQAQQRQRDQRNEQQAQQRQREQRNEQQAQQRLQREQQMAQRVQQHKQRAEEGRAARIEQQP